MILVWWDFVNEEANDVVDVVVVSTAQQKLGKNPVEFSQQTSQRSFGSSDRKSTSILTSLSHICCGLYVLVSDMFFNVVPDLRPPTN